MDAKRLDELESGSAYEPTMLQWDDIRRGVVKALGDYPRLQFESIIDEYAEAISDLRKANRALEADKAGEAERTAKAIADEREACAKRADETYQNTRIGMVIGPLIRARTTQP